MQRVTCEQCGGPATVEAVPSFGAVFVECDSEACGHEVESPLGSWDEDSD